MECPECRTENPPGERLCLACGTEIGRNCPVCGYVNPFTVEACGQCGHDLRVWQPPVGLETLSLVDRDGEMAAVETAMSRADHGEGQVVGILGMPGVGKTRLCRELIGRWRTGGIPVCEVRCFRHGKHVSYLSVRDLLRSFCRIRPEQDAETVRGRIAETLSILGPDGGREIPLVQAFLGVGDPDNPPPDLDPDARQDRISAVTARLVLFRSKAETIVLLLDDAQWLDPESDGVVTRIVEGMADTRLLLLLTFRPGYHAVWTGKTYYHQLALHPFGLDAGEEMLRNLLGEDPSLDGGLDVLITRTHGYPGYIEEAVRWLMTSHAFTGSVGACRLVRPLEIHDVPPTLESTILERVEALPEMGRRVLYAASVIGGRVPLPVLRHVTDLSERDLWKVLEALRQAAFMSAAEEGADECCFAHSLLEEVTYVSQPPQRRARVHAVVAAALEDEYAANLGEHAALIAYHWDAANDKFKADLWRRRALRGVKAIRVRRGPRKRKKS